MFIYCLRPKLKIGLPEISKLKIEFHEISKVDNKSIVIPVKNLRCKSKASKISIEVAVVKDGKTFHLKTDINDFAFIPGKKSGQDPIRKFKAYDVNDYLHNVLGLSFEEVIRKLNNQDAKLRVRIHATHSFSGLGKTFEECFEFNNNTFINKKC